jgi:hypothetical protein
MTTDEGKQTDQLEAFLNHRLFLPKARMIREKPSYRFLLILDIQIIR